MEFTVDVYQNEYLTDGACDVHAIVTVSASGVPASAAPASTALASATSAAGEAPAAAEVIVVDCSGSMDAPRSKMVAARRATVAAIDALRDGVLFAVVAGTEVATVAYPARGARLVPASAKTRAEASRAVSRLAAGGGTAIGRWLRVTNDLLSGHPEAIRHAIVLTDGRNEGESPEQLADALAACAGHFTCDCRGVGTDWSVPELRTVASALLGTVDIVADPAGLEADFRSMMDHAMGKSVADLALRLWTPMSAAVRFVKQVAPTVNDLTERGVPAAPQSRDYPIGSWGAESRDYHVCVEVRPGYVGEEMLAGRLSVVAADGTAVAGGGLIRAVWTEDEALSTRINREVAHYTGQAELADAIQEGLHARKAGDDQIAVERLGRAVALATASGHTGTTELLARVVDIVDAATGSVRLKPRVDDADEMALDTRSTKTVRAGRQ